MEQQRKKFFAALATPLSSIFGSGFLVIVPILAAATGEYAVLAMLCITIVAFLIGEVIRFNIRYAELALENNSSRSYTYFLELFSELSLVLAYVISISLYLRILSSFLLAPMNADIEVNEQLITTGIIVFITLWGVVKGLKSIEKLEFIALGVTLVIIFFVTLDFSIYDIQRVLHNDLIWPNSPEISPWKLATILGGTLIVVQGFETSRYLGGSYSRDVRIRSSRASQIISTVVYLLFVASAVPLMHYLGSSVKSNDLILLSGKVIFFLASLALR